MNTKNLIKSVILLVALTAMCVNMTSCSSDDDEPDVVTPPVEGKIHRIEIMILGNPDLWQVAGYVWGWNSVGLNPELKTVEVDDKGLAAYLTSLKDDYNRAKPSVYVMGITSCRITSLNKCEYMTANIVCNSKDALDSYPDEVLVVELTGYVDGVKTNSITKEIHTDKNIDISFSTVSMPTDKCVITDRVIGK